MRLARNSLQTIVSMLHILLRHILLTQKQPSNGSKTYRPNIRHHLSRLIPLICVTAALMTITVSFSVSSQSEPVGSDGMTDLLELAAVAIAEKYGDWNPATPLIEWMEADYNAGHKHLAYFGAGLGAGSVSIGPLQLKASLADLGVYVYFDLDDYMGITEEGRGNDGRVTVWVDVKTSLLSAGIGLGAGISRIDISQEYDDPYRGINMAYVTGCAGPFTFTAMEFDPISGFKSGSGEDSGFCAGASFSLWEGGTSLIRFEIDRSTLNEMVGTAIFNTFPGATVLNNQAITYLAAYNIVQKLIQVDNELKIKATPDEPGTIIYPFTTGDNATDIKPAGMIDYAWGGADIDAFGYEGNGLGIADNAYPHSPWPMAFSTILVEGVAYAPGDYAVQVLVSPHSSGWSVYDANGIPYIDNVVNFSAGEGERWSTEWSVHVAPNATEEATVLFGFVAAGVPFFGEDELLYTHRITLNSRGDFALNDAVTPNIEHTPINEVLATEDLLIEAIITDDTGIESAYVYTSDGSSSSIYPMEFLGNDRYRAIIPESLLHEGQDFEYYIAASDRYFTIYDPPLDGHPVSVIAPDTLPDIRNSHISATSGDTGTPFTFQVTYTDIDNDPPDSMIVVVDSTPYMLASSDNNYTDGAIFTSDPITFERGIYTYYFEATQGDHVVTTEPQTFYVRESVEGRDLALTYFEPSRESANQGDTIRFYAQVNNREDTTQYDVSIQFEITGPGNAGAQPSYPIGTLYGRQIFGGTNTRVLQWDIPHDLPDGSYRVRATVVSSGGEADPDNNVQYETIVVGEPEELEVDAYRYYLELAPKTTIRKQLPNGAWADVIAYGPITTVYSGRQYTIYVFPKPNGEDYGLDVYDQWGEDYQTYEITDENLNPLNRNVFLHGNRLLVAPEGYGPTSDTFRVRYGHPTNDISISAPQTVEVGEIAYFDITLTCGTCPNYHNDPIYNAYEGEDPPRIDFSDRLNWDYTKTHYGWRLEAIPTSTEVQTFAFATEYWDIYGQPNYYVWGRVQGYEAVDYPPTTSIDNVNSMQLLSEVFTVNASATDAEGISRVELWVNNRLIATDTTIPYRFNWNTASGSDGLMTLSVRAYDTANQMATESVQVIVDNNAPAISDVSLNPSGTIGQDVVSISFTVTDTATMVANMSLRYSIDDGISWLSVPLSVMGPDNAVGTIPAQDEGVVRYEITATDVMGYTSVEMGSYVVADLSEPQFGNWRISIPDINEYTPSDQLVRVHVTIWDSGGSGDLLGTPGFAWHTGDGYEGWKPMVQVNNSIWYYDIPAQDWDALQGQTLYYRAIAIDGAGNVKSSSDQTEFIQAVNDRPVIRGFAPITTAININPPDCETFSVTLTDDENDTLYYTWYVNNTEVATSTTYEFCATDFESRTIRAVISDGELNVSQTWETTTDTEAPTGPGNLSVTSHTPDSPSMDATIDIVWSADSSDTGGSGLAGYSILWDSVSDSIPDTQVEYNATTYAVTSDHLANGTWYVHLRACDNAGNCGPTLHVGPLIIDAPDVSLPEYEALLALYDNTNGAEWHNNEDWLEDKTVCDWYGITCDNSTPRRVEEIGLSANNLNGALPDLSSLIHIHTLNMSHNQLTGPIPDVSSLTNLVRLYLESNRLTGNLPDFTSNKALTDVYLEFNQLEGAIPDLSQSESLWWLSLAYNQLSGSLPTASMLPENLEYLNVIGNQLTGEIPDYRTRSGLKWLYLAENQLTGTLDSLAGLVNLVGLDVRDNRIFGSIPDVSAMTSLGVFDISSNQLEGEIPASMLNLSALHNLDLAYNGLWVGDNPELIAFLETHDLDWQDTQTVPVANLAVESVDLDSVRLIWTPVQYQADEGFYRIMHSTDGVNWTQIIETTNKQVDRVLVAELGLVSQHYFCISTVTLPHERQASQLTSVCNPTVTYTSEWELLNEQEFQYAVDNQLAQSESLDFMLVDARDGHLMLTVRLVDGVVGDVMVIMSNQGGGMVMFQFDRITVHDPADSLSAFDSVIRRELPALLVDSLDEVIENVLGSGVQINGFAIGEVGLFVTR